MPSQDYIKGKADIFSFVLEILNGARKNRPSITCAEIVDRIERYVNTPLLSRDSVDYNAGVGEALTHFRRYFVPRDDVINSDAIPYVYNAVEEQFEQLWRLLDAGDATGSKNDSG